MIFGLVAIIGSIVTAFTARNKATNIVTKWAAWTPEGLDESAPMSRDEFILYDTYKNISMLIFLSGICVIAIGLMGMKVIWCVRKPEAVQKK